MIDPALFQENERLEARTDDRKYFATPDFLCENGAVLPKVVIAYETWGELNASKDNAVVICHALSGDSHAIGWWDRLVGPGKPIDTERYFVIGTNALGGCNGSTGPSSLAPDGKSFGSRFRQVTVGDMVEAQMLLTKSLGISQLLGVAGGSMGGMMALEWTLRQPGAVRKAWITASAAAHNAMQIGFNEAARQAIKRDPRWLGGDYLPTDQPVDGLAVARMIGHISFLSEQSFDRKFGRKFKSDSDQFEVESYLNYQGEKFTKRFDANSLIVLTRAIDLYDRKSLRGSQSEYLFTSFTSDWIYPPHQSERLHQMALEAGCKSQWRDIPSLLGHDAFLLDGENQGALVKEFFLGREIEDKKKVANRMGKDFLD